MVLYVFVDDKLVRSKYAFDVTHSNKNDFISDFDKIGEALENKYGEVERQEIWLDDLY